MADRPDPPFGASGPPSPGSPGPVGGVYEWYVRGVELLEGGDPAAASQLLARAAAAEPTSRSIREALARALFDAGRYEEARAAFRSLVAADPADDYALFGVGLAAARLGDHKDAVEHLALAAAMRPDVADYGRALRRARAARGTR
jgi:tetratricopeptide (TPR) repeat protein